MIRKAFFVSSSTDEKKAIRVRASSQSIDRADDVVIQDFDLTDFEKNPVVLWEHGIYAEEDPYFGLPIGFASDPAIVDGCLELSLNFVDEKASPIAPFIRAGMEQKSIRAVSIGFDYGEEKIVEVDGKKVRQLSKNKLVEVSVCAVGMNADAVQLFKTQKKTNKGNAKMEMSPEQLAQFIAQLATKLGLPKEQATPEAILAKLDELCSAMAATQAALEASNPTDVAAKSAIAALALKEVVALRESVRAQKSATTQEQLEGVIRAAIDEGKLLPALAEDFRTFGRKYGVERLKSYLGVTVTPAFNTAPIAPTAPVQVAKAKSKEEIALQKAFGLSDEDLVKYAPKARA